MRKVSDTARTPSSQGSVEQCNLVSSVDVAADIILYRLVELGPCVKAEVVVVGVVGGCGGGCRPSSERSEQEEYGMHHRVHRMVYDYREREVVWLW